MQEQLVHITDPLIGVTNPPGYAQIYKLKIKIQSATNVVYIPLTYGINI